MEENRKLFTLRGDVHDDDGDCHNHSIVGQD